MTQQAKKEFVKDLTASILKKVLEALPRTPEDWDGHELRMLLADEFKASVYTVTTRRKRAYVNAVAVNNL